MRLRGLATAVAMLAASACQTGRGRSDVQAGLIDGPIAAKDAHWVHLPSGAQVVALYPARARAEKLEGRTRIRCKVRPSGDLARCVVLQEIPTGYGFGAADLKFAKLLKLPPGPYGPHASVEAPIDWRLDN